MGTASILDAFDDHQRARGLARKTVERRRWALSYFADPLAITADDVEAVMARLPTAGSKRNLLSDLRAFFRFAVRRGLVDVDPTLVIEHVRVPSRAASPVSVSDLHRMLEAAPNEDTRLAVMLAAHAGLRVSEIGRLDMADVRHDLGVIVVRSGKGGGDDIVPLAPELARALDGRSGPLYARGAGPNISGRIRRLMRRLEVRGRPHDLRATFGTNVARRAKGNLVLVAQLMRHKSYATSQRYIDWSPEGRDVIDGLYGDAA